MAELAIIIKDIEDGVEVECTGDRDIKGEATSAQVLANKCMELVELIQKLVKQHS